MESALETLETLETLRRWETAGGHWEVLSRSSSGLIVALLRCDRGEEVHRFASPDAALAAYIGERKTDEDEEDSQRSGQPVGC